MKRLFCALTAVGALGLCPQLRSFETRREATSLRLRKATGYRTSRSRIGGR